MLHLALRFRENSHVCIYLCYNNMSTKFYSYGSNESEVRRCSEKNSARAEHAATRYLLVFTSRKMRTCKRRNRDVQAHERSLITSILQNYEVSHGEEFNPGCARPCVGAVDEPPWVFAFFNGSLQTLCVLVPQSESQLAHKI